MPVEPRAAASTRTLLTIAGVVIATAILFGGGGTPAPVAEAVVEFIALLAFAAAVFVGVRPVRVIRDAGALGVLVGIVLLFPILQLVPLPPALWQTLPGREAAMDAMELAGGKGRWSSWSLLPDGGVAAVAALVPAAVVFVLTAGLPPTHRTRLIGLVAVLGLVAAILGLLQFAGGATGGLQLYRNGHEGWGTGFFANRNAQADFLAIALTAGLLMVSRWRVRLAGPVGLGLSVAALLMLAGGVASGSRMGMAVLGIPVVLAGSLAGRRAPALAICGLGAAGLMLAGGTALDRVAARAHDAGNRTEIWGDSVYVARQVAPLGAGIGSFQPLYAAAERLDHVQPTIANRAHNDYLELAIEGGVPALAVLAAALAIVGRRAAAGWRDPDPDRRLLARFAGLTTLILAVHSFVDYPLRNLTLLSVAALALAGLVSIRRRSDEHTAHMRTMVDA